MHAANVAEHGQQLADRMWAEEHDPVTVQREQDIEDAVDAAIEEEIDDEAGCAWSLHSPAGDGPYGVRLSPYTAALGRAVVRRMEALGLRADVGPLEDGD